MQKETNALQATRLLINIPHWIINDEKYWFIKNLIQTQPSLEETIEIAKILHGNQKDISGEPYINHLLEVLNNLIEDFPDASMDERIAAVLHDSLEDVVLFRGKSQRKLSSRDLALLGYNQTVITYVQDLTNDSLDWSQVEHLPADQQQKAYEELYLDKIRDLCAKGRIGSMRIKRSDNKSNLNPDRVSSDEKKQAKIIRLRSRYTASIEIIDASLQATTQYTG